MGEPVDDERVARAACAGRTARSSRARWPARAGRRRARSRPRARDERLERLATSPPPCRAAARSGACAPSRVPTPRPGRANRPDAGRARRARRRSCARRGSRAAPPAWPWRRSAAATARLLARFSSGAPQVSVIGIGVGVGPACRTVPTKRLMRRKRGKPDSWRSQRWRKKEPDWSSSAPNAPGCSRRAWSSASAPRLAPIPAVCGGGREPGEGGGERAGVAGRGGVVLLAARASRAGRSGTAGSRSRAIACGDQPRELRLALVGARRRARRAAGAGGAGRCRAATTGARRRRAAAAGRGRVRSASAAARSPGTRSRCGRPRGRRLCGSGNSLAVGLDAVLHPVDLGAAVVELPDAVARG